MPKNDEERRRLLAALLRRHRGRPTDASRALGRPDNTVSIWKNRKVVPRDEVAHVRAHLYGTGEAARSVQPLAVPMNEHDTRLLREFVHIILRVPGIRDVLLGMALGPEDRRVLSETIERFEGESL